MTTTPRLWKSLTQVNTTDAAVPMSGGIAAQGDGHIARLGDGGYVVVWADSSRTHNANGQAVVGQRYDSFGNKVGGEVKISQFDSGDQFSPAVMHLPNGNIAIAFVDSFSGDQDIYVRVYNSSLGLVRTDIIDTGANQTFSPSISAFADGSYVLTYTVGIGADTDIVARIVSPTGTVGAQFDIDNQTDNRNFSQVTTLANGNFVVVYQDELNGSTTDIDIKYAIVSPTGAFISGPTDVPGGNGFGLEVFPDVAARPFGGFVVAWTDPDSTATDIRATVFNSVGGVVASNILVNTTTTGEQNEANVVALSDGNFVVTWEDDNANLVRAQRFDALGTKIGTEFTVKAGVSVDSPEAALLTDGRIGYAVGDVSTGDADVMTSIWDPRTLERNFDGINQSDLLWQNDNGQGAIWLLNDTNAVSSAAIGPNPGPSWHLLGDGDFNKDGRSDFLWQHDGGQVAVWLNGGGGGLVGPNGGPSWHVIDAADFNGDGNDDILWQHDSGQAALWLMDGLNLIGGGALGSSSGADWHIKAAGDFNGDGKSDILWQHDSGQAAVWLMNGTSAIGGGLVGGNPGSAWHVIDAGDFNGDLRSDILWQHDSGQAAVWFMSGTTGIGGGLVGPNPGSSWHVVGAGQFNNSDIKSDILWQHDSGLAGVWLTDGGGGIIGGASPGADWHLIA